MTADSVLNVLTTVHRMGKIAALHAVVGAADSLIARMELDGEALHAVTCLRDGVNTAANMIEMENRDANPS